jgi:hypothetical protein
LTLEAGVLSEPNDGSNRIEQPADARSEWRVNASDEHGSQGGQFIGRKRLDGCGFRHCQRVFSEKLEQDAQRGATRLAAGRVAARQAKPTKVRDPFPGRIRHEQEFASPHGAVGAVTGPIPSDAENRGLKLIVGHARQDMSEVMLNRRGWRSALLRIFRREVIRVKVCGYDPRRDFVESLEILDHSAEGHQRLFRFQIPNVLAEEDLRADGQSHGVLQMSANREDAPILDFGF